MLALSAPVLDYLFMAEPDRSQFDNERSDPFFISEEHLKTLAGHGLGISDPAPLEVPLEIQGSMGNFFVHFLPSMYLRTRPVFQRFQLLFPEQEALTTAAVQFWHRQYVASMRGQPHDAEPEEYFDTEVSPRLRFAYQAMAQLVDTSDPGYAEDIERYGRPNVYLEH